MKRVVRVIVLVLVIHLVGMITPVEIFTANISHRSDQQNPDYYSAVKFPTQLGINENALSNENSNWISLISNTPAGQSAITISKSRDTTGMDIYSSISGFFNRTEELNGTVYNVLTIPNAAYSSEVGNPAVPHLGLYIEVPHDVDIEFEVRQVEHQIFDDFNITPAQSDYEDYVNATKPPFTINETLYETNAFYPENIVSMTGVDEADPIVLRGHRIITISLCPIQFNPVTQQIRAHSVIELRISYSEPSQITPIESRLYSHSYEEFMASMVVGYQPNIHQDYSQQEPHLGPIPASNGNGADYLVITYPDFLGNVTRLAEWKIMKGLKTKVVTTVEINPAGPTADDIADYIQDAYDNWNPAPSYVLLVGDSDHIPPHYRTPHTSVTHGGFEIPTDLYYGTVDGTDCFPDIFVGRLSADDHGEVSYMVQKILDYEINPPSNPDFYSNAAAVGFFQDRDCDNQEDRAYILTSEEIRDYLQQQGYDVDRLYYHTNPGPLGCEPLYFNDGSNLPDTPPNSLRYPDYLWDTDLIQISDSIEDGKFMIYHRDHGRSDNLYNHDAEVYPTFGPVPLEGWEFPHYDAWDIYQLTNAEMLPVFFSIECQGAWFDSEVDEDNDNMLIYDFESFCEAVIRNPNGGGIAAVGATRNSWGSRNDQLLKGCIQAIWPTSSQQLGLRQLGQILTYGKLHMASNLPISGGEGEKTKHNIELYHLFGDPELSIRTQLPKNLDVTHPTIIGSQGQQQFVVKVRDSDTGLAVPFAKVCLTKPLYPIWQGIELHEVEYTDSQGIAYFDINPSTEGSMRVVTTSRDYIPYEGTIEVGSDGVSLAVNPNFGDDSTLFTLEGSGFDSSEGIYIEMDGIEVSATESADTNGDLSWQFQISSGPQEPISVSVKGLSSLKYAVTLFNRLSNPPETDPHLYSQWEPSTWYLNPLGGDPIWNNPDIEIFDSGGTSIASSAITTGQTYTVRATIHNTGLTDAVDTDVSFQWSLIGAGGGTWEEFGTDQVTVPAGISFNAETEWDPQVTGHVAILVSLTNPFDMNIGNNVGQENTHVLPVTSPGSFTFAIANPLNSTVLVEIEAFQVGSYNQSIWPITISRDYPQTMNSGEQQTVTFSCNAPNNATIGENRRFIINSYLDGELIGGLEVIVEVQPIDILSYILFGGVLVIIIVIIIIFRRRR